MRLCAIPENILSFAIIILLAGIICSDYCKRHTSGISNSQSVIRRSFFPDPL